MDALPQPTAETVRRLDWKAIAAMAENRVIGRGNRLPWHLPEDFRWVKECTAGKAIVMGRRTFESMGRPLPGRLNIVLSRSAREILGCTVLPSLAAVATAPPDREVWIFGGAEIYRQALPLVAELYLTVVAREVDGDAWFPPFEDLFTAPRLLRETPEFRILHYRNRLLG
jgi:dihydrofolate reductase